ncbi:zinc finger protein 260-like [Diorhabda sublineata]|uniref:zinc finger protein 260-like n=1 Tax=Diorhabda sublineata TaxID=1163346 RepID=UPI0024E09C7D|nr:zinc finger protein 260-like [Diorhabda sublineata]
MNIEFGELCRICLSKVDNMKYLLDSSTEITEIISMLSSIINSEINLMDCLPSYLCKTCEEKLKLCFDFQQMSQKSNNLILQYIDTPLIVIKQKDPYISIAEFTPNESLKVENIETVEEISVLYENNNNSCSDNESKDEDFPKKKIGRNTTKIKLSQHDPNEVMNIIKETKLKFYESKECLLCNFTAINNRTLSRHMTKNHSDFKDKWCRQCNKIVENISQHVETVHKDDLKCKFCGKKCRMSSHFVEHLMHHCVDHQFTCETCKKCFTTIRHLKYHLKIHQIVCEICSETFLNRRSLLAHNKIHNILKCKICNENFNIEKFDTHVCFRGEGKNEQERVTKSDFDKFCIDCNETVGDMDKHIKAQHNKGDNIRGLCTYCGKQFKNQSYLTIHLRRHTKDTPFKCRYCDVTTVTKAHLQEHERTHTGEKPYKCKFCGKAFIQRSILSTHLKIHTGRTEQCHLCPKKFCRPSELRTHMRKHTGEKPYACQYCDRTFIQKSHLTEHIKIHTDDRPFKCHICDKAFKQSSTLKGHISVHEGKNIFKCGICSYTCKKNYKLTLHIQQHQETNYKCEVCEEIFTAEEDLNVHQNTIHENMEIVCEDTVNFKYENYSKEREIME